MGWEKWRLCTFFQNCFQFSHFLILDYDTSKEFIVMLRSSLIETLDRIRSRKVSYRRLLYNLYYNLFMNVALKVVIMILSHAFSNYFLWQIPYHRRRLVQIKKFCWEDHTSKTFQDYLHLKIANLAAECLVFSVFICACAFFIVNFINEF